MGFESVKSYFFKKLIFPKRLIIDKPGVLINQLSRRYGGVKSQHRTLFIFEDIIVRLQLNTIEEIGMEATRDMWYKIGKDVGLQYMILGEASKIPKRMLPIVVDYVFSGFRASGMFVATEISYSDFNLKLRGKGSIICRKTGVCDFVAGIVAGIMSVFWGKNVEAVSRCGFSKKDCKIICNDRSSDRYIPVTPTVSGGFVDFKDLDLYLENKDFQSFGDLVRFKKILIAEDGKFEFFGKTIMAVPVEFMEIIARHYKELGLEHVLKKSEVDASRDIFSDIFVDLSIKNKMASLVMLHTSLGWGIPFLKKDGKHVIVRTTFPLSKKVNFFLNMDVVLGFLESIFGSEVNIYEHHFDKLNKELFVEYRVKN